MSPQHLDILDRLASSINETRDRLVAHAIVILQLIDKGALVVDYNSLADEAAEAPTPEVNSCEMGGNSTSSSKSAAISSTSELQSTRAAIENDVFKHWLNAVSCYYRLELEFRIWKSDLDSASGPDLLKACDATSMHPARLN